MPNASNLRTGGQVLIDQLKVHGVDMVFCVPGESYLAALDAFHDCTDQIKLVTCRHEAAAANMAEVYGKLTGRPGVCFVTRGPGACHASIGLHTALQDSSPMVLFIGQIARHMREREAFQEMNYGRFFAECSKWAAEIDQTDRIPEMVSHAFHAAVSGRPGPVALALPEDMLREPTSVQDARRYHVVRAHPGSDAMARLRDMLLTAERPVMMLGGGTWTAEGVADITAFAEAFKLPVTCAFRNQDRFDNNHPNYAGDVAIGINPKLLARLKAADLLLLVGPRLGEQTSQDYSLVEIPRPAQTVIHVHAGAEELGRVFQADLLINAGMPEFAKAAKALPAPTSIPWEAETKAARQDYLAFQAIERSVGALDMAHVVEVLRDKLPPDTLIANDAGNFAGWAHRYLRFSVYPSQVGPTSGAMGYGVPAAIAAAAIFPKRQVVGFTGDGGFLMSGQEIATALQYGFKPLILVINNNMYGTIRMHQERDYPGRNPATELVNPDFAAYAKSFGAFGEVVERDADFEAALERALAADRLALLELRTDPEAINTRTTLAKLREVALKRAEA
ncbi:MAG: thiamine pyrophosphate-binding protein [Alphaproteobacteria bacterium]|jgi:acetolactate synthase-1/2/3 large subunit|nr:thiamine pyrophosphate-binding protein [Alphaproteobacteria bacterium]